MISTLLSRLLVRLELLLKDLRLCGAEFRELTVTDVEIICYIDIENSDFKIYRIKLTDWQQSIKVLIYNKNDTEISGEHNMRKSEPREFFLKDIKVEVKGKRCQRS